MLRDRVLFLAATQSILAGGDTRRRDSDDNLSSQQVLTGEGDAKENQASCVLSYRHSFLFLLSLFAPCIKALDLLS